MLLSFLRERATRMSDRASLSRRIDRLLQRLSSGLTPSDAANGWSEQSRAAMIEVLEKLRDRLAAPQALSNEEKQLNLPRGMDFWGITGGDLLEEGAEISCELNEMD